MDQIEDLFEKWVDPVVKLLEAQKPIININLKTIMQNFCKLLDCFMKKENGIDFEEAGRDMFWISYERLFVFCIIWSFGNYLKEESRKEFDVFMRDIEGIFPISFTVYDYYYNLEKNEFINWEDKVTIQPSVWKPPLDSPTNRYFVETSESIRFRYIINLIIQNNLQCVCVGQSGSGKSILINSII